MGVGNANDYILWPYENVQDFQSAVTMIKFAKDNNVVPEDPFNIDEHEATPQMILSDLFTEAIIEVNVIQNTLDAMVTYTTTQQVLKENIQFDFKLYEMALMDHYDSYTAILVQFD